METYGGLTKREWFAGLAMQGLLASGEIDVGTVTSWAVGYADALIAELAKGEGHE
jgi:hypothetical protein